MMMTRQRRVILEEVVKCRDHPRADQIYERVRRRLPKISLGTVYRTLDLLSERGLIRRLELGGNRMRFDGRVEEHYHIRCLECDRLVDVDSRQFACIDIPDEEMSGFRILGHQLEFFGLCPDCMKGRGDPRDGRDN